MNQGRAAKVAEYRRIVCEPQGHTHDTEDGLMWCMLQEVERIMGAGRRTWLTKEGEDMLQQAQRLMPVNVPESKIVEAGLRELVDKLRRTRG